MSNLTMMKQYCFLILAIAPFVFLSVVLSGCGFHPVYGVNKHTATGVEAYLESVSIGGIPDREGQYLRNALIDRFYRDGRPRHTRYDLTFSPIRERQRNLDVTIDSDTTRAQLTLLTSLTMSDKQTGDVVLKRNLQSTASYNVLGSEFANRVSEQSTRENILDDLARQIEMQIGLHFKR